MSTDLELPMGQRVQALWTTMHREHGRHAVHGAVAVFTATDQRTFDATAR